MAINRLAKCSLVLIGAVCVASILLLTRGRPTSARSGKRAAGNNHADITSGFIVADGKASHTLANRMPEDRDGFTGLVHPLLHGNTRLEVSATWSTPDTIPRKLQETVPQVADAVFRTAHPA